MELPRPLFSPNSINKKKFTSKKFSRKMELSYTNIKKYIYFLKIKLFLYFGKLKHQKKILIFQETELSYISRNENPKENVIF